MSDTESLRAEVEKWQQRYGKQMGVTDEWVARAVDAERKVSAVLALADSTGSAFPYVQTRDIRSALAGRQ